MREDKVENGYGSPTWDEVQRESRPALESGDIHKYLEPMASLGASRSDSDFVALPSQQAVDQMKAAKPAGFRLSETIGSCLSALPVFGDDWLLPIGRTVLYRR